MKKVKASVKNYHKLVDKGINPLHPTMRLDPNVKFFVIHKDNFFSYQR